MVPWREVTIDLRRSDLSALDPIRDWKRFDVKEGQYVTIRPGGVVMARVYERFRMPNDCAGKIEGRSAWIAVVVSAFSVDWFVFLGLLLLSLIPALLAYERSDDGYLGKSELQHLDPPSPPR